MQKRNSDSYKLFNIILVTAGKTLLVMLAAVILFSACFLLLAPRKASNFCLLMGMNDVSAWSMENAAKRSGEPEDWYNTLLRADTAGNVKRAWNAAQNLVAREDEARHRAYLDWVNSPAQKEITVPGTDLVFSTDAYVQYLYCYYGMKYYADDDAQKHQLVQVAKIWTQQNGYASTSPLGGIVDALLKDSKLTLSNLEELLAEGGVFDQVYHWGNTDSSVVQRYVTIDARRLLIARPGSFSNQTKALWNNRSI